jgi:hypothetical protein
MTIKTPLEDFVRTTLAAVPGYWHKLVYLANLRSSPGSYDHWGMARSYGLAASHSAISAAHCDLFVQVLRTPIKSLAEDVNTWGAADSSYEEASLEEVWQNRGSMLPTDLGGGSAKHFEVTLLTVRKLIQTKKGGKNQRE